MSKPINYKGACFRVLKVAEPVAEDGILLDSPESVGEVWERIKSSNPIVDPEKEHLLVLTVNTRLKMTGYSLVSVGTVNESLAHPREIFRPVIVANAYGFVLVHNHPSGETIPSEADRRLTRRIKEASELLQIHMLDHVIVGDGAQFSFKASGVI